MGRIFDIQPIVAIYDKHGNQIDLPELNVTVHLVQNRVNRFTGAIVPMPVLLDDAALEGNTMAFVQNGLCTFFTLSLWTDKPYEPYMLEARHEQATTLSRVFTVLPETVLRLRFDTQPPSTMVAGVGSEVSIKVGLYNSEGNLVITESANVMLSLVIEGDMPHAQLAGYISDGTRYGIVTFTGITITEAGRFKLRASGPILVGATSDPFLIFPSQPNKFILKSLPPPIVTADEPFLGAGMVLSMLDRYSNIASQHTGPVHMSVGGWDFIGSYNANPQGMALSLHSLELMPAPVQELSVTHTPFSYGTTVISDLDIRYAGTHLLFAVSGLVPHYQTPPITVVPTIGVDLIFGSVLSPDLEAGKEFDVPPTVVVLDAFGNRANRHLSVLIELQPMQKSNLLVSSVLKQPDLLKDGVSSLGNGAAALRVMNGIAIFRSLSIHLAGNKYSLRATAATLKMAVSNQFTVHHAAPFKLEFIVQPPDATLLGQPFPRRPVVQVHDPYGNLVTVDTIGVSLQNVRPNSEPHEKNIDLRGITHRLTAQGIAEFEGLSLVVPNKACRLIASSAHLRPAISSLIDVVGTAAPTALPTLAPLPELLPVAVSLVFVTQPPEIVVAGELFVPAPQVAVFRSSILDSNQSVNSLC
jgi:hypothetical protein